MPVLRPWEGANNKDSKYRDSLNTFIIFYEHTASCDQIARFLKPNGLLKTIQHGPTNKFKGEESN